MRKLIAQFVKHPFYANMIIGIVAIAGIMGYMSMKKSFFPEMVTRNISVSVLYPGASPKEMEEAITVRIEEAIRGIVGIKHVTSTSAENFANVNIETTGEYDIDETLSDIKNSVDGISSMPVDAERPIVRKLRAMSFGLFLGLYGDVDKMTLKKIANEVEYDFLRSGVMSQINVNGLPNLEISIEASEQDLLRYNLTFDDIQTAVALNNTDISAGMIRSEDEEILIRSRRRSVDPNTIEEIILRANPDGSFLRIRDVAKVKIKFEDLATGTKVNGVDGVSFQIQKLISEDLEDMTEFCYTYAEEFNKKYKDIKLEVTYDFNKMLTARIDMLLNNGGIGLLLVVLALALFLSFRLSLWVAWGIPFSFLGMFIIAGMYGITINMLSLFGMILVVGILVDDGIVIAENIYAHFERGKEPAQAAVDGTMEMLPAVVTSVLTTIIAFIPVLMIEGRMAMMFDMAFVVIFSLFFSLFEAFFVLPAHLAGSHVMKRRSKESLSVRMRAPIEKFVVLIRDRIYGRILKIIIKNKYIIAVIPIALLLITVGLFQGGLIKGTFFPTIPPDFFKIDVTFKQGEGEKQTQEYIDKFDKLVWQANDELMELHNDTIPFINYSFPTVGAAFDGAETGSHTGNIFVSFTDLENRSITGYDVIEHVKNLVGEVPESEKLKISGDMHRFGKPISISLMGSDLKMLDEAKHFVLDRIRLFKEIDNVTDNSPPGKREVLLDLKPKAYFLGLNHASISKQVRQGFFGGQAQRLQNGKDELRVWVRYPKSDRLTIGQLEKMKIKTPQGGEYPLTELVDYHIERGPVSIKRYNSYREVRVEADMKNPFDPVPKAIARIEKEILQDLYVKYPNIIVEYQGQEKEQKEATADLMSTFLPALLLIIIILMIHFRSGTQAIIVIMMIPLAWMAVMWGHGIENRPFSMLSAFGMVALAGVIINDAVVFLSKFNALMKEGRSIENAVYKTGIARFRAILLTTLTTSAGLYPIILETSFQARFLQPMAISLAYGVFIGTAFILLFFPAVILILNDIRVYTKYLWTGVKPT
ncbi:MAG: efflux RND transporter permease subunit, partial [Chlorobi bacterium]|nr:efflux RND transporter permease subunit [Chlorobiota bacterium]